MKKRKTYLTAWWSLRLLKIRAAERGGGGEEKRERRTTETEMLTDAMDSRSFLYLSIDIRENKRRKEEHREKRREGMERGEKRRG